MPSLRLPMLRHVIRQINTASKNGVQVRNHGSWAYRVAPPPPSKKALIIAETMGAIAWWWILWHMWTEPGHVIGEWPIIEPSQWTDAELGIPPDSEGPAPRIN